MKTLFVAGLGLIGGSVARGARANGLADRIVGFDRDAAAVEAALAAGVLDEVASDLAAGAVAADITVLATPVGAHRCLLMQLRPVADTLAAQGRWVTDTASVKCDFIATATELFGTMPDWLVPGHPLAGSQHSGFDAAQTHLYRDRKVLLCPTDATRPAAVGDVAALGEGLGATVEVIDATQHDRLLGMTSHLPHLLAFGLLDALLLLEPAAGLFRYSGGGFRDFTRIASSDPAMWRDILLANANHVLAALDHTTAHLGVLRAALAAGDGAALTAAFSRAKLARDGER